MKPKLRTIIAGSRTLTNPELVDVLMYCCPWEPSVVISGHARGFDKLGEAWAIKRGIPLVKEPCTNYEWMEYGRAAGHYRNERMITKHKPDALAIYIHNKSNGSEGMLELAHKYTLEVHVLRIDNEEKEIDDDDCPF